MQSWTIYCLALHVLKFRVIASDSIFLQGVCLLHVLFVTFTHVVECSCNVFVFAVETHRIVWINCKSSIHSPLYGHRVAAVHIDYISWRTHGRVSRWDSQEEKCWVVRCVHLNLTRRCQVAFQDACMNLCSHKQCIRACIVPQPWQHLVLSDFNTGANLVGVSWHIMEVLGLHFSHSWWGWVSFHASWQYCFLTCTMLGYVL